MVQPRRSCGNKDLRMKTRDDEAPEAAEDPAVDEAVSEPGDAAVVPAAAIPAPPKHSPFVASIREWGAMLRDYYLTFDRRVLGFTRLLLGFYLIMDICHRGAWWQEMYSTEGILPNN